MGKGKTVKYLLLLVIVMSLIYGQQSLYSYAKEEGGEVQRYQLFIAKEIGKNGYSIKKPDIMLVHTSAYGVTKYEVRNGEQKTEVKMLKEKNEKVFIEKELFSEGKNILHVWMEDEEGVKIEKYEVAQEFFIDTEKPEIQIDAPKGFQAWYQNSVTINVKASDAQSGIERISCKVNGNLIGSTQKESGEFMIDLPSEKQVGTEIQVIVEDRAGNTSEKKETIFIDKKAPDVSIVGAKDYTITAKPLLLTGRVSDENGFKSYSMEVFREDVKGRKRKINPGKWTNNMTSASTVLRLEKDGIYHIRIHAADLSGHITSQELQVIIDKKDPVIRYVDKMDQQYLRVFQWKYLPEQMIQDFTTYTYDMRLDGQLYHIGQEINKEGRHYLVVNAEDAAGNKAKAEAEFVIDRTKPEIIFTGVKDGKEYEEECTFQVRLERTEDVIEQISINGEEQKIVNGKKKYQFRVHELQDYEIVVRARDLAGNEEVKKIYFRVIPKETVVKKILKPIVSRITSEKDKDEKITYESERKEERIKSEQTFSTKAAGLGIFGIVLIVAGIWFYKRKRKDLKGKVNDEIKQ